MLCLKSCLGSEMDSILHLFENQAFNMLRRRRSIRKPLPRTMGSSIAWHDYDAALLDMLQIRLSPTRGAIFRCKGIYFGILSQNDHL